jgi:hypothetical protein
MEKRMKKVIWIDDSVSRMKGVVIQLFPELWKNKISCELVFLGDNFKVNGSQLSITPETLKYLQRDLDDQFRIFCYRQFKEEESGYQTESKKTIAEVYADNGTLQPQKPIDLNEKSGDIPFIMAKIKDLAKGFETYVGLDIQLDIRDDKINKLTQAMQLFHGLYECKNDDGPPLKVFLYTSAEDLDDWKDKWFNKVKGEYDGFNPVPEKIFRRNNLLDNSKADEEKQEFYSFLGVVDDNKDNGCSHS